MNPLEPFRPSAAGPWDRAAAAHLLRRSGFSPSEAETRAALASNPAELAAKLCDPAAPEAERSRELDELGETLATRKNVDDLRGWWLLRMRHTDRPLHARLCVFWHNHFATSDQKVRYPALMYRQLRTIEAHALGRFEDLVIAMARDPAMILWLDNQLNTKGRPNENFARELFELFTLGVGNYDECDIKEAARAFTGWQQRNGEFHFARGEHDDREKTIFGKSGRFDGADVVRLALAQPACSQFIAGKLLREFVGPSPSREIVDAAARRLRETKFDIGATLLTLFSSTAFFEPVHRRTRIKSPVEFVLGLARSLELHVPAAILADATAQMGQALFEPPSVKGWDGHRAWLTTATMLVRLNAAVRAATPDPMTGFDPAALRRKYEIAADGGAAVRFALDLALDGVAPAALENELRGIAGGADEALTTALQLLMSSPEYQMA